MLEFFREGTPWWVSTNFAADADIVVPRASNRGALPLGQTASLMEENRIILLGFHYSFTAANGNGFDLIWVDNTTPSSGNRIIASPRASTAITHVEGGSAFCFIPGPGGQYSPVVNGATLRLDITATGPTDGRLLCWGIHVDADWKPGKSFTGSPITF